MPFTPYIGYVEALQKHECPQFPSVRSYVLFLRDVFVRDTPFKYRDIREIHNELNDLRPDLYDFESRTIGKVLNKFKREGYLVALDSFNDDPSNHTYMFSKYYRRKTHQSSESFVEKQINSVVEEVLNIFDDLN